MPNQWRLNLAIILTLGIGAILVGLTQNRSISEVLALVIVALMTIVFIQYFLLFRGRKTTHHPELRAVQQDFVKGKFQAVIDRLEEAIAQELPDDVLVAVLTLQGNAYRQLGQLDLSEGTLQNALQMAETNHYPLYGLGRTLLATGKFDAAEGYLDKALTHGAKKATRADHVLAQYYAGFNHVDVLQSALQASKVLRMEPYRALMVNYVLYQLYSGQTPPNTMQMQIAQNIMRNTQAGVAFWSAEAQRFAHTPYGQQLSEDVEHMQKLIEMQ